MGQAAVWMLQSGLHLLLLPRCDEDARGGAESRSLCAQIFRLRLDMLSKHRGKEKRKSEDKILCCFQDIDVATAQRIRPNTMAFT